MHENAPDCAQYWQLTGNSEIPCGAKNAANLRLLWAGRDKEAEKKKRYGNFFHMSDALLRRFVSLFAETLIQCVATASHARGAMR